MSRKIAFGGALSALTVILLYFAAIAPSGKLVLYTLSSLPAAFMLIEFGISGAITLYFTSTILSYFLTGNILGILPFVLFFGIYPVVKYLIERNKSAFIEIVLKLGAFNISLFTAYYIFKQLGASFEILNQSKVYITAAFIGLQIIFAAYDYIFTRIIMLYYDRFRLHITKK